MSKIPHSQRACEFCFFWTLTPFQHNHNINNLISEQNLTTCLLTLHQSFEKEREGIFLPFTLALVNRCWMRQMLSSHSICIRWLQETMYIGLDWMITQHVCFLFVLFFKRHYVREKTAGLWWNISNRHKVGVSSTVLTFSHMKNLHTQKMLNALQWCKRHRTSAGLIWSSLESHESPWSLISFIWWGDVFWLSPGKCEPDHVPNYTTNYNTSLHYSLQILTSWYLLKINISLVQ